MGLSRRPCIAFLALLSLTWSADAAITDVRLVDGSSAGEGRVEVRYDGVWGEVCHNKYIKFLQEDARVICRTLGFNGTFSRVFSTRNHVAFGRGTGSLLKLNCSGTEASIAECLCDITNSCSHDYDVGLICYQETTRNAAPDVRLVGGAQPSEGRIEIFHGGQWKRVSGDSFYWKEAQVVCRTLGFESPFALTSSDAFGQGSGSVIHRINCLPTDRTISDCSITESTPSNNPPDHYAGVVCIHDRYPEQPRLRLTGPSSNTWRGRVEVYYEGQWGTICGKLQVLHLQRNVHGIKDRFGRKEAKAVCRDLGFESFSGFSSSGTQYGNSAGPVLLVNCPTDATGLEECDSSWGPTSACISDYTNPWVECRGKVNECASNPCLNGATCTDDVNGYTCTCSYGFWGIRCESGSGQISVAVDDLLGVFDALGEVKTSVNVLISVLPDEESEGANMI